VGLDTAVKIIERIEARVARDKYVNTEELNEPPARRNRADAGRKQYRRCRRLRHSLGKKPYVLLVIGVNGVGKTTTIGKLASQFKQRGHKVVLGAADTFRAAAVDQLKIWAERVGCDFYSKGMNADPAAVAYETTNYALENHCDVAIIDTAGRLHNKSQPDAGIGQNPPLHETKSARRPARRAVGARCKSTGQNAQEQAKHFTEVAPITCLALTKLDGTAKGGVAIGISDQFKIPIRYIGVGERIDQLQIFNKRAFVESLFEGK
jgi:fused signal recognition particle receptor